MRFVKKNRVEPDYEGHGVEGRPLVRKLCIATWTCSNSL